MPQKASRMHVTHDPWFRNGSAESQIHKLKKKLANVPEPIKWLSKCCHWGKYGLLLARPLRQLVPVRLY